MRYGVQTTPQRRTVAELVAIWRQVETAKYDVITVPDHLSPIRSDTDIPVLEATTLHALLAANTDRVECGALVYCAPLRPLGLLARSLATISAIGDGRCFAGVGAGWWVPDFDTWGVPFGTVAERSDHLEELTLALARLLRGETVTMAGSHVTLREATCPVPDGASVPIWVAGNGEARTLPTTARHADGWNSPFAGPEEFLAKNRRLDRLCEDAGRDPRTVRRSVNVRLAWDDATLAQVKADMRPSAHEGILSGSPERMRDRIGAYADAGAELVVLDVRHPQPTEDLLRFAAEVMD